MDVSTVGLMDGRTGGRTDRHIDGRMDGQNIILFLITIDAGAIDMMKSITIRVGSH